MKNERGRPRSFDIDIALDCALKVFWKHGFQAASLHELISATGLSKPSLYAAFGNKKTLYLKALERYMNLLIELHTGVLTEESNGRQAIEAFLRSLAKMFTNPSFPGGCFIINGTADLGGSSVPEEVEVALCSVSKNIEKMILERLLQAQCDGHLPKEINPQHFAILLCTLMAGLAVQAKRGVNEDKLNLVITATMTAWPE